MCLFMFMVGMRVSAEKLIVDLRRVKKKEKQTITHKKKKQIQTSSIFLWRQVRFCLKISEAVYFFS